MPDGLTWLYGLGLPHVLLWVLTFAVTYAVLKNIINKRSAALISIATGFFVLMAVPTALVGFLATMSTGLVALTIGVIALIAIVTVAGAEGSYGKYKTVAAVAVVAVVVWMFVSQGGLALVGIPGIPPITPATWLLIIVGIAVVWMLSEKTDREKAIEAAAKKG